MAVLLMKYRQIQISVPFAQIKYSYGSRSGQWGGVPVSPNLVSPKNTYLITDLISVCLKLTYTLFSSVFQHCTDTCNTTGAYLLCTVYINNTPNTSEISCILVIITDLVLCTGNLWQCILPFSLILLPVYHPA